MGNIIVTKLAERMVKCSGIMSLNLLGGSTCSWARGKVYCAGHHMITYTCITQCNQSRHIMNAYRFFLLGRNLFSHFILVLRIWHVQCLVLHTKQSEPADVLYLTGYNSRITEANHLYMLTSFELPGNAIFTINPL